MNGTVLISVDKLDSILEMIESDRPAAGIEAGLELLESEELTAPQRSELAYALGVGYFKSASYKKSLQWLDRSKDDRRWLLSGYALQQIDENEGAARAFAIASRTIPEQKQESRLLQAQALLMAEKPAAAASRLDEILTDAVKEELEPEVLLSRGIAAQAAENSKEARKWFQKLYEKYTDSDFAFEAAFYLIQVEESLGQIKKALEYAEWLKNNSSEQVWQEIASEFLRRLHGHRRNQKGDLRNYDSI